MNSIKSTILLSALLLGATTTGMAKSTITTTVDGKPVATAVRQITFEGDNAILHYSDNSTSTHDMGSVGVALVHGGSTTGVESIATEQTEPTAVYDLRGIYLGNSTEGLEPGVYIVNGKKTILK